MVKNKHLHTKKLLPAFTLAEVLIAMLIMSLFFMATTKVMTIKQKPLRQEYPHGYYECYDLGGSLKEHRVDGGTETIARNTPVGICHFLPPKGQPIFTISIAHTTRGFYSTTESQINEDDGMEFSFTGANDIIAKYQDTMDTEDERFNEFIQNSYYRYIQFRNYIKNSYPDSVLGRSWSEVYSQPPFNEVFIVW